MAKTKVKVGAGGASKEIEVEVEDGDAKPWGLDARLAVVGTEVARVDGAAKADGSAKYTHDVARPGMAFAAALRCPHAHAHVKDVDLSAARALPGVLAAARVGPERVTFPGTPVAVVCAETERALDDSLRRIRAEYEVLPHVVDATEARRDDAPRVDPSRPNLAENVGRDGRPAAPQGDPEKALAEAEAQITAEYATSVQDHVALEPHGSVAEFAPDGALTLWCSTQDVRGVRRDAAQTAKLPESKVRVLTEFMGGGFGCKFGLDDCDRFAIRMAKETGRPVKCMNDRREEHLVGGNRPDSVQRLTLGGTKDGRLTVLVGESYGTPGNGRGGAAAANTVLYDVPNVSMRQSGVSTFTALERAFRAPGHPQGVFALESAVDEFAHAIGKDPLEVRRLNDRHPVRTLEWPIGAERIGWAKNRRTVPGSDPGPVKRGVGCAGGRWGQYDGGQWQVNVAVARDGSVVVSSGAQDIGTGTKTVLAVLVAEELGVSPARVRVRLGDSDHPAGPGSGGSVTAGSLGPPAREAAMHAKEAIAEAVGRAWETKPDELVFAGDVVRGPGGKETSFEKACSALGPDGVATSGKRRKNWSAFTQWTGGCQFAAVAVDVETGVVRVERVVAVHDAGRIVDPLTARSQVNGGVIQGISYALFEERRLDRGTGDLVNPTYDTYRILGMADCPEIDVVFMPMDGGRNNVGMAGLGEPATVPTAAAVANAVYNAIGVRVRRLPMTPARVLAALRDAKGGAR